MSLFSRIFRIGQTDSHNMIDKLEAPIKLTEQGIVDLKKELDDSLKTYAEVKALSIKSKKESNELRAKANSFEQKAVLLIQKAGKGEMDPSEADRIAGEALVKKEEAENSAREAEKNANKVDSQLSRLDQDIKKLRSNISHLENELKTLKARSSVSGSTGKLDKQMAQVDSAGTITLLEKMKLKASENEIFSDDDPDPDKRVGDDPDESLKTYASRPESSSDALSELKERIRSGNI